MKMTKKLHNTLSVNKMSKTLPDRCSSPSLMSNKRAIVPLLVLLFSPIGIVILVILALVIFGIIGFGIFLTFNLLAIGGVILIIAGLIAVIQGNLNQFTLGAIGVGAVMLILPMLIDGLGGITLATILA